MSAETPEQPLVKNIRLTSGRTLVRSFLLNLVGQGFPIIIAFFSIPLLIARLGTEQFGILILSWVVIGYFSLFDFGLGRALTQLIAQKIGAGQTNQIPALFWTAIILMVSLGFAGSLVLVLISPFLIRNILEIPAALHTEAVYVFYLLSLAIPFVIFTTGLIGVLTAFQRFDLIIAVRIPMSLFTYVGPLLVLTFFSNLVAVVVVLVAGRLLGCLVHLFFCFRVVPSLHHKIVLQLDVIKPLLRFGGWMTITNIVGPLMVYMDRFLLGALVSLASVTYYATPYEMVTKLWVISFALVHVLFPAFTSTFVQDRTRTMMIFERGVKCIFLVMFPITLVIVTLAHEGLAIWLGAEFAQNSTLVLQVLAIGTFLNSLAQAPFTLIQGAGRPDLTARLHLIELPFYIFAFWWLVEQYGIQGAAVAWTLRMVVDNVALFMMTKKILSNIAPIVYRIATIIAVAMLVLVSATSLGEITTKGGFLLFVLPIFAVLSWFFVLGQDDRDILQRRLKNPKFLADRP